MIAIESWKCVKIQGCWGAGANPSWNRAEVWCTPDWSQSISVSKWLIDFVTSMFLPVKSLCLKDVMKDVVQRQHLIVMGLWTLQTTDMYVRLFLSESNSFRDQVYKLHMKLKAAPTNQSKTLGDVQVLRKQTKISVNVFLSPIVLRYTHIHCKFQTVSSVTLNYKHWFIV